MGWGTRISAVVVAAAATLAFSPSLPSVAVASEGPVRDPKWPSAIGWKGCPAPIWPQDTSANADKDPGNGRRVLVIGDSLTREARKPLKRALRRSGWTPTIRCWGGKRLDWALAQVDRAKKLDQLPNVVVISIGTNDMRWIDRGTTLARMEMLIDRLGPKRTVVWVDTYASGGDRFTRPKEKWFNRQVKKLARKHDNVHRVNWGKFARRTGVRFIDDLHYDKSGEKAWAARVTAKVDRVAG